MIADSQLYTPRLTHSASIVYNYLLHRPNQVVTIEELKLRLYVGTNSSVNRYVSQIKKVKQVDIEVVRGIGYRMRTI